MSGPEPYAVLTRQQWQLLNDTIADLCGAAGGSREDLHDLAVGVLETCRPEHWTTLVDDGTARPLWCRAYEIIGALAHLADAAPHDARQIRRLSVDVRCLAEHMRDFPGRTSDTTDV
ncbi:hypothetical protein SAXI111661_16600 [Saccharomonospora xinjiangensis]|uniref:hypothetical protein n=1 Tax=Saccharomonospora xinjiangensis TaxID=75294 RepID=UPI00106F7C08|nr:hypothetical protein [Saccharomonospora xinjiangensis]QBQ62467.1 hypothetical protein EYD13_20690 [Saccharomonospora xinjiangensis]